jgi:hypothetical protein
MGTIYKLKFKIIYLSHTTNHGKTFGQSLQEQKSSRDIFEIYILQID